MGLLALTHRDSRLVVRSRALHVERAGVRVGTVPIQEVSEVLVYGAAEVSTEARNLLLRHGVHIVLLTADGRYRGRIVPPEESRGALRLAWYRLVDDPPRRLDLARSIVRGKIRNQRTLLAERNRYGGDARVAAAIAALDGLVPAAATAATLDVARGVEGMAAKHYFDAFGRAILNPAFTFAGRTRRPPRDPVNAVLSYGYALLVPAVESALRAAGLDVSLAALHEHGRGGPVLAFDLAEEFRPIIDGLTLTLVNRRELRPEDFRTPGFEDLAEDPEMEGAVYLGRVGREVVLRAWQDRLEGRLERPVLGGQFTVRRLFQEQARQLARLAQGEQDAYHPVWLGA